MHFTVMFPSLLVTVLLCTQDVPGAEQNHSMMVFEPLGQERCWLSLLFTPWKWRRSGRTYQTLGLGGIECGSWAPRQHDSLIIWSRIKTHLGQECCLGCSSSCLWISWSHRKMVLGFPLDCAALVVLALCITDHIVSASYQSNWTLGIRVRNQLGLLSQNPTNKGISK